MPIRMYAVVKFDTPGIHNWPGARGKREYLASPHRHLFHIEVELEVFHQEREVEYHDLLDFCRSAFPGGDQGEKSCETMAMELGEKIAAHYQGRILIVSIFEDGEVGARLVFPPR